MIGGESNAATSKEHTSYYARVLAPDGMQALDVLADRELYRKTLSGPEEKK